MTSVRSAGLSSAAIARGVEREPGLSTTSVTPGVGPSSKLSRSRWPRGVLQPLQPLLLGWIAQGELGTLTAVDAALMVIDAAKGVEAQTIKLLNVCRLRHTPIVTFMNKYDREVRDSLELLDEVENVLNIRCAPITWPIGMGKTFRGVYHLLRDQVMLFEAGQDIAELRLMMPQDGTGCFCIDDCIAFGNRWLSACEACSVASRWMYGPLRAQMVAKKWRCVNGSWPVDCLVCVCF